jgi:hypothetical protein
MKPIAEFSKLVSYVTFGNSSKTERAPGHEEG